jgi:predicted ATPase
VGLETAKLSRQRDRVGYESCTPNQPYALTTSIEATGEFIIATHSPILLACLGARIYSFDESPIGEVKDEELEHVVVTRDFLNDPSRFTGA